jgi:hypothetical protein
MTLSPQAGFQELMRRVNSTRSIPVAVIQQAHRELLPLIPVYTGAYKRGVMMLIEKNGQRALLYVSAESLQAGQRKATPTLGKDFPAKDTDRDYVFMNIHGKDPEGPYPLRIEEHGRPTGKFPRGDDAWGQTRARTHDLILQQLALAAKGAL